VTIDIDYGETRSIWKDNRLKDERGKLVKFNTLVDALNIHGEQCWKLVNAIFLDYTATNSPPVLSLCIQKRIFEKGYRRIILPVKN
jgi:hypothetical protein